MSRRLDWDRAKDRDHSHAELRPPGQVSCVSADGERLETEFGLRRESAKQRARKRTPPTVGKRKKALFSAYVGFLRGNLKSKPKILLPVDTKRAIWLRAKKHVEHNDSNR